MFESAASAAELYLMNKAAVKYLTKKSVYVGGIGKNGHKPRDLIIDILTSCCPVTQDQALKVLSTLSHTLISIMSDNKLFANVVNAKNHQPLYWAHVD